MGRRAIPNLLVSKMTGEQISMSDSTNYTFVTNTYLKDQTEINEDNMYNQEGISFENIENKNNVDMCNGTVTKFNSVTKLKKCFSKRRRSNTRTFITGSKITFKKLLLFILLLRNFDILSKIRKVEFWI